MPPLTPCRVPLRRSNRDKYLLTGEEADLITAPCLNSVSCRQETGVDLQVGFGLRLLRRRAPGCGLLGKQGASRGTSCYLDASVLGCTMWRQRPL
jgi:hypothetical protein